MRDSPVEIEKIAVLTAIRRGGRAGAYRARRAARSSRGDALSMANIHSQEKRILRAERERHENRRYTSKVKTYFRRLEAASDAGDAERAAPSTASSSRTIDKAVKRGALHANNGARKKSRATRLRKSA